VGNAEPSRRLLRRLPAVATSVREIRALTVDFARTECNADDQLLGDIALCVSEAAANVIAHAYTQPGGDILLTATLANHTISIEIRDQGSRRTTPSPGLGLGLGIIHTLSDATIDRPTGDGMRVTMRFPCNAV
jgi:anti-sigma regulatory factor (Ser/Thr protein kinase)